MLNQLILLHSDVFFFERTEYSKKMGIHQSLNQHSAFEPDIVYIAYS